MMPTEKRIAIVGMTSSVIAYGAIRLSADQWPRLSMPLQYLIALVGMVGVFASLWSWWLAVVDWYRRRPRMLWWGIALVILNVIAAWGYWILDVGTGRRSDAEV
jgi:hypothetical protein